MASITVDVDLYDSAQDQTTTCDNNVLANRLFKNKNYE